MCASLYVCQEVVTRRLPRLSKEEAGAVAFLGHDPKRMKCDDVAANPEVFDATIN